MNVLLVVYGYVDPNTLRREIRRVAGDDARVHVVAPPELSRIEWLTTAVDEAREDAVARATLTERAIDDIAQTDTEDAADSNPILAIEDALRTFAADRIVVVTRPKDEANWRERRVFEDDLDRFGIPTTHLVLEDV